MSTEHNVKIYFFGYFSNQKGCIVPVLRCQWELISESGLDYSLERAREHGADAVARGHCKGFHVISGVAS